MKRPFSSPPASSPNSSGQTPWSAVRIWADTLLHPLPLKSPVSSSKTVTSARRHWLDPASLQFRLTLGVTAFSILGLGGVASWTSWKMQQILVNTHTENIKYIGQRFPQDVALYSDMLPVQPSVQRAIDDLSPPNLLFWVTAPDGKVFAQSQALKTASSSFVDRLQTISKLPLQPQVYQIDDRYFVLCSAPLTVEGRTIGELHLAEDITSDQNMLNSLTHGLSLVSMLSVLLMATAITLYIRQALHPLRKISHTAGTISASDLSQAKLSLHNAPTEVRELAETLNEMLSRLALSWEQQQQLIGNISHELRTPLTVTSGYLQCMKRRAANLSETQQEMLDTALAETDRTIQLLQSLLDLARADTGCMYLRPEDINLNELVNDVVKMSERSYQRHIKINADVKNIKLSTDRDCLSQALTHLIENAAKYSPIDQPVLIQLAQDHDQITIQVRDFGCGIASEQQQRIFEPFYRVDDTRCRNTGGVGLGLALVKTLIEHIDGQIQLWSQPGEGSLFTITLPAQLKG